MSFVPEKNKRPLCPPKPIEKPLPDDKVEALRNELRLRIAALKQARIEYENKLHTLNGLAKEVTSQQILYAVGNIDFSALAKDATVAKEATLNSVDANLSALVSEERETIMGGGTDGTADNVIDTQGLLIPGFTAVVNGQTYYLAGFYIDGNVGAMPFQANEIMYTGAPNVGTCLRTDAYADIVAQTLQPDHIAALAIPIATTGDPYIDESGEVHNVVTEPMTLGKVYRLKSIVPITYNDPEEEITSFDLYVWEEAKATGRNIAETYNLIQETSQTIINELGNIDFEPLEQKVDTATEDIMGGKKVTHSMDNLPAAQCGTDNSDFRPVFIGDADYTLTDEYAFAIANGLSVGDVIRVLADNSGDGHEPMAVPKTINEAALAIMAYGSLPTIDGVTEWLQFEQHKHYIVTGIHETTYDGYTWFVYTFDEYEPGRSGREVYDKVKEVKTAVENINVESADQLAQFFGVADSYEAEAKGGERTNNTVIDECKVRFQDAFNGLLPTGFTMPNSVTVDNLTYTGTNGIVTNGIYDTDGVVSDGILALDITVDSNGVATINQ